MLRRLLPNQQMAVIHSLSKGILLFDNFLPNSCSKKFHRSLVYRYLLSAYQYNHQFDQNILTHPSTTSHSIAQIISLSHSACLFNGYDNLLLRSYIDKVYQETLSKCSIAKSQDTPDSIKILYLTSDFTLGVGHIYNLVLYLCAIASHKRDPDSTPEELVDFLDYDYVYAEGLYKLYNTLPLTLSILRFSFLLDAVHLSTSTEVVQCVGIACMRFLRNSHNTREILFNDFLPLVNAKDFGSELKAAIIQSTTPNSLLPTNFRYIAIHIRQPGFKGYSLFFKDNARDADPRSYFAAIRKLKTLAIELKVRFCYFGDTSSMNIPNDLLDIVIDCRVSYGNISRDESLRQLAHIAQQKCWIGTLSGVTHLAPLFNIPTIYTNTVYHKAIPWAPNLFVYFKNGWDQTLSNKYYDICYQRDRAFISSQLDRFSELSPEQLIAPFLLAFSLVNDPQYMPNCSSCTFTDYRMNLRDITLSLPVSL